MPFTDLSEVETRIRETTPITEEDIRDLMPWARALSTGAINRLNAEVALLQLAALKRQEQLVTRQIESFDAFDISTASANSWMLRFTAAVTFMTLVLVAIAVIPLFHK